MFHGLRRFFFNNYTGSNLVPPSADLTLGDIKTFWQTVQCGLPHCLMKKPWICLVKVFLTLLFSISTGSVTAQILNRRFSRTNAPICSILCLFLKCKIILDAIRLEITSRPSLISKKRVAVLEHMNIFQEEHKCKSRIRIRARTWQPENEPFPSATGRQKNFGFPNSWHTRRWIGVDPLNLENILFSVTAYKYNRFRFK